MRVWSDAYFFDEKRSGRIKVRFLTYEFSGGVGNVVDSGEVARVMVGDGAGESLGGLEAPRFDQFREEFGMVNDFEIGEAEVGVLVFECVETVGTGCDNFFDAVFVESRNIGVALMLKSGFVTDSAGEITSASFFLTEAGE